MTKLILPLGEIPGVIRESARTVVKSHGFVIAKPDGSPLNPDELERLFSELGRNSSQALFAIDSNPENE